MIRPHPVLKIDAGKQRTRTLIRSPHRHLPMESPLHRLNHVNASRATFFLGLCFMLLAASR
jgi:hypothetical protein